MDKHQADQVIILQKLLPSGVTSFFVQIPELLHAVGYSKFRMIAEQIDGILAAAQGHIKISIDCEGCPTCYQIVKDIDYGFNCQSLLTYRTTINNSVKLIPLL